MADTPAGGMNSREAGEIHVRVRRSTRIPTRGSDSTIVADRQIFSSNKSTGDDQNQSLRRRGPLMFVAGS